MTGLSEGEAAVAKILADHPALSMEAAVAFLWICGEEGLSLKALSQRMGEGQSTVARHVAALAQTEADGTGLVVLSDLQEGELRRTVHLTPTGRVLCAHIEAAGTPAPKT